MNKPTFKELYYLCMQKLTNFPYIEQDFDALTNYELLCKVVEELNKMIQNINTQNESIIALYNAFNELKEYIDNYFENLDVQEEINKKLDEMAEDGTLTTLISNYVDPIYEAYEKSINTTVSNQNIHIDNIEDYVEDGIERIETKVDSVASGSPLVASSTSEMTNTSRVYVNTTDGKWYYYDGDSWEIGGTYQATEDSETVSNDSMKIMNMTTNSVDNLFNPYTAKDNFGLVSSTGEETPNESYFISDFMNIENAVRIQISHPTYKLCLYDSSKVFIKTIPSRYSPNEYDLLDESSDFVYARVQILKTDLAYEQRYLFNIAIAKNYDGHLAYTHLSSDGIGNNEITVSKYNSETKQGIITSNIEIENNPFSYKDFRHGNVNTQEGWIGGALTSIIYKDIICLKAGTSIYVGNDYQITAFMFDKDGTYKGRYGTWFNPLIIGETNYYRLVIHKIDTSNISKAEIKTIVESMSVKFEKNDYPLHYIGEPINLSNLNVNYIKKSYRNLGQDACQYNGKIFVFDSTGGFNVIDTNTRETLTGFVLDQNDTIKPHCNCVCFSNQFYDNDDEFPLLYVNAYNTAGLPRGTCYVHRIINNNNVYTTTLIQTITIGFAYDEIWTVDGDTRFYGNFLVNTDKSQLIAYTLRGNNTRFFIFNLPNISNSEVTLQTSDIIDYFDCPFFNFIQGGYYNNGKVYSVDGIGSHDNPIGWLHIFDLNKKELVTTMDLKHILYEPECIFEMNNNLYVGQIDIYELIL